MSWPPSVFIGHSTNDDLIGILAQIWDLKTCRDTPCGFRSAINNFGYYQQAAYYLGMSRSEPAC